VNAADLGIDDVLDVVRNVFGIEGEVRKTNRGPQMQFLCVVHQDSDPSADVHLETGYWNCWSCSAGGDIIDLGARATGKKRKDIRKLLVPDNPDAKRAAVARRAKAVRGLLRATEKPLAIKSIIDIPQDYPTGGNFRYLRDRGFTKGTLDYWGIRYVREQELPRENGKPFTITNAFGIPIRDEHGEVIGWCYRASPQSEAWFQKIRYIYTPGLQNVLNQTWYGLWENWDSKEITVTEGAFDAIWNWQCGYPAVAVLGNQAKQIVKIRKLMHFRHVTLFLDRDRTGAEITEYLGSELTKRGVPVDVARFSSFMVGRDGKPAKDSQDLCPLDVDLCHVRALPYGIWKGRAVA
jgi:5S rRNA maturation endonuclease (ribonuclease M5)